MIYTVNGPISKEEMGTTLSHEHFKWETDENYGSQLYFEHKYDDKKIDEAFKAILPVLEKLSVNGCQTIVEASTPLGGQNLKLLRKLSLSTKINIVPTTGECLPKYVHQIHREKYAQQLAERWIKDFEQGLDTLDGITVRPGQIKLLLDRGKLSEVDREMLRAAIWANKKTGIPIHCHILEAAAAEEVMDLLEVENANFKKFLWAHPLKEKNDKTIARARKLGIWLGVDMIKSDAYDQNMNFIKEAIEGAFESQILLSQDYEIYDEVVAHGENNPCASFFTDFIPYCVASGIPADTLNKIIRKNPAEFFDF